MPYGTEVLLQKVTYCPLSSPDKSPLLPYIHHSHTVLNEKSKKKNIAKGSTKFLFYDVTFCWIQYSAVTGFTDTGEILTF